jgi:hypothetical protein
MTMNRFLSVAAIAAATLLAGCAHKPVPYDYTAFKQANPKTLLVMPPLNDSPEVKASSSVWAQATLPLAEAGYYVLPVTLVDETLRQNGIDNAYDAQNIPTQKLRDFFGADAAVYIKVTKYGTAYHLISSDTVVEAQARIVDLRSGKLLWEGKAMASSAEQGNGGGGGLVGALVAAAVKQVINTATDAAYNFAGVADSRLLGAPRYNGVLAGPRSPNYGKDPETH